MPQTHSWRLEFLSWVDSTISHILRQAWGYSKHLHSLCKSWVNQKCLSTFIMFCWDSISEAKFESASSQVFWWRMGQKTLSRAQQWSRSVMLRKVLCITGLKELHDEESWLEGYMSTLIGIKIGNDPQRRLLTSRSGNCGTSAFLALHVLCKLFGVGVGGEIDVKSGGGGENWIATSQAGKCERLTMTAFYRR